MTDLAAQGLDKGGLFTEKPSSIKTWKGRIDPLNAKADEINIEDIAHALARQCRYNGHTVGYLSVARHSIWVSLMLELQGWDEGVQRIGLLHDAAEAYLGDLVRPLKQTAFGKAYLEVEAALEEVIAEHFDLIYPFPPEIYEADNWVLTKLELADFRFNYLGEYDQDEEDFLARYNELTDVIAAANA